ncbi:seminase-like [Drosophila kikkawai]|uniref:Seminase-like n=1 Tax=Drosophila kikkawai TaxID=30033 RepID=A0A6P4IMZ3_DROKI|nr:seminase-like [Drosophila kikkawai]
MQGLLTCWLLAVTVQGTLVSAQNERKEPGQVKQDTKKERSFEMRVVGGRAISNPELGGYIIAMRYFDIFACGGTLIHDRIVLSAAHCFINREVNQYWVLSGGISSLNETGEERKIKDVITSPNFSQENLDFDVAVILLDKPLVGKNIAKLSLCTTELKVGMQLDVSGWGHTKEGASLENNLRTVTVPYIDRDTCRESYRFTEVNITDNMICAGVLGSKDACLFDSGGPLVYQQEICGIVSFGIGCARKDYPGVYTDVKFMKPFIEQSIQDLLSRLE